jgi:hypothetical protein
MVLFVFNLLNTGSVFKLEHRLHGFFLECVANGFFKKFIYSSQFFVPDVMNHPFFLKKEGKDEGFLDGLGVLLECYDHRSDRLFS